MGGGKRRAGRTGATESRTDLVVADKVSPSPTTQITSGIDDRLVKREVENKTRTKQIDGGRTNGSFLVQNFFLKRNIFTGKFTIR